MSSLALKQNQLSPQDAHLGLRIASPCQGSVIFKTKEIVYGRPDSFIVGMSTFWPKCPLSSQEDPLVYFSPLTEVTIQCLWFAIPIRVLKIHD